MKKSIYLLLTSITILTSCSSDDVENIIDPNPPTTANAVQLANDATFGNILTDSEGMSLYFFSRDTKGQSECNGDCKTAWPIFYEADLTLDEGLDAADFGVITRADGERQNTYKGWPLYYFVNDSAAGDTNGDKVGNNWYIAKPDYSLMYAEAQLVGRDADGNDQNFTSDYTPGDGLTFYITNSTGRTIYAFVNDTKDTNNYTADDFSNDPIWPIISLDINNIPSILDSNDFGTIDVFGRTQVTYKGRPLYYFGQDVERGDNYGISVPTPGIWPVVNTDTTAL